MAPSVSLWVPLRCLEGVDLGVLTKPHALLLLLVQMTSDCLPSCISHHRGCDEQEVQVRPLITWIGENAWVG